MIGTLKLIFGSIPFGKNNWNQSLPVTMNECLTTLYWNFGPLFFCQLLQVSHIWRVPSPNCCFEIMPQVCYGIKIWTHLGHFRTLQCFVLTISGCFLKCAMGHCPAGRPMSSDGDPAFWHWALHCAQKFFGSPQISWCHAHSQGIGFQKQQSNPKTLVHLHHVWL